MASSSPCAPSAAIPTCSSSIPRPLWRLLGDGPLGPARPPRGAVRTGGGRGTAPALAPRARGTPFLFCSAQNIDKRYPPPFRWIERWSLRRAAGAYSCNTEARRILRRKGLDGRVELLPLGVDVERFRAPDRQPPTAPAPVGFVGRLIPHKGVDVLLRAVALDDRLRADIFGAGPEAEALAALAATLGIGDRVRFHGHVDEARSPTSTPRFDVLAVPSVPMPGLDRAVRPGRGRSARRPASPWWPVPAVRSPDVVGRRRAPRAAERPRRPARGPGPVPRRARPVGPAARVRVAGVGRYSWKSVADAADGALRAVGGPRA